MIFYCENSIASYSSYDPAEVETPSKGRLAVFLNYDRQWLTKDDTGAVRPSTDDDFRCILLEGFFRASGNSVF
jgi:hypothetical protein